MRTASSPRFPLTPLAAAALTLVAPLAAAQQAPVLPTGPVLRAGAATVNTDVAAATQTVTQTSARAAIDWTSYSIGADARVQVNQPGATSVLLNRVVGADGVVPPSLIDGSLSANGRVFLLNTAGILFGGTARVNVGGLLASTLDLADADQPSTFSNFVGANSISLAGGPGAPGYVVVMPSATPQLVAGPGGEVLLIGNGALAANTLQTEPLPATLPFIGSVTHAGGIATSGGRVHLAAGDGATVAIGASGFVSLAGVGAAARAVGVATDSRSTIANPGGSVVLESVSQPTLGGLAGLADRINLPTGFPAGVSAVLAGGSIGARNGTAAASSVEIKAAGAASYALVGGRVDVSGDGAGSVGGRIVLDASNVALLPLGSAGAPASLDASGPAGGGLIALGGSDALRVQIAEDSVLAADATAAGDGGTIRIQALAFTPSSEPEPGVHFGVANVGGTLSAQGRGAGRRGGSIETSGAALNIGAATIDASGQGGAAPGRWLIDPYDVAITADPTTAVADFEATGFGANIRAADIGKALDGGTSVTVSTGSGGPASGGTITLSGDIVRAQGEARLSLTLSAADAIVLDGDSAIRSTAGPLDVTLASDADGNGSGPILADGATIATRGGHVLLSGGVDPATGFAAGIDRESGLGGIDLFATTIDARGPAGAGAVTLRGSGALSSIRTDSPGIVVLGSRIDGGDITLVGRAGRSTAIAIGDSTLAAAAGTIALRGVAGTSASPVAAPSDGVAIGGGSVLDLGTGSLVVAGRGENHGVLLDDVRITTADGGGGRITIVGESAGAAPGVQLNAASDGVTIGGTTPGAASGADVVLGAKSAAAPRALDLANLDGLRIATTGRLNLRPAGVGTDGTITEDVATPITFGAGGSGFVVDPGWFAPLAATSGITAQGGTVIGSSLQRGAITVQAGALAGDVTLQNEGAGSGGITLAGGSASTLGLLSAGAVTQTGALVADRLVVRGGPTTSVTLGHAGNRVATVAFDPPQALTLRTQGDLTVGAASALNYDAASGAFGTLAIAGSRGGDRVLLQSLDGDLILGQPIAMQGANSQLDLVAADLFRNPGGATLTNGAGGAWRIWSRTWVGGERGGLAGDAPAPNLYGCAFGDSTSCSASGAPIPATGNRFLFVDRPTVTATASNVSLRFGDPLPAPLPFSVSGVVNGDSDVLSGAPTTSATPTSPVGQYPIDAGTLAARQGYLLTYVPGVLDLGAPFEAAEGLEGDVGLALLLPRQRSEVYELNFAPAQVCAAPGVLRREHDPLAGDVEPIAIEWSRVRSTPQLSSCLNLREGADCAAF